MVTEQAAHIPTTQELIASRAANTWVPVGSLASQLETLTSRHAPREVTPSDVLVALQQVAADRGHVEMARVLGQAVRDVFEQELRVLGPKADQRQR